MMEHKFAERLGEFIEIRTRAFIDSDLPHLTVADIEQWNTFNEDMRILAPDADAVAGIEFGRLLNKEHFSQTKGRTILYRILCTEISIEGEPWIFRARVPMIESSDLLYMLLSQYGVIFIVLAISLSLVFVWISKRLWRPFYETLGQIENFSLEAGREPHFKGTDIREFHRLNERLGVLIRENLGIYRRQKEFIENASHEMQTPLAVISSNLDTMLQQPGLTASQTEIIQSLYTSSSRMARLNKNLLLLAKMDNAQFEKRRIIDFATALDLQLSPLVEFATSNGITVSVESTCTFTVNANEILLESLITNLIVNAIRHNHPEGGDIAITVGENMFSIANTGVVAALDDQKIFTRFNRSSEDRKGNGLGLSIVRRICDLHGWRVEYDFVDTRHTFTVSFRA